MEVQIGNHTLTAKVVKESYINYADILISGLTRTTAEEYIHDVIASAFIAQTTTQQDNLD